MSETPPMEQPPSEGGGLLGTVRHPRIVLLLLGAWAALGAVTEFFTSSDLFVDLRGVELDGALGGRALSWEQIPLAVLYFYCARDPVRYHRVFWLALVEQAAAIAANIYHLGAGDFSAESVIVPIAGAGVLALLVFLHLFQPKEAEEEPYPAGGV